MRFLLYYIQKEGNQMAKKITPEQVEQMELLYAELGTYSAVAREMGISAGTVSRYLKEKQAEKAYTTYSGLAPCNLPTASLNLSWTEDNEASYQDFVKEFC